MSLPFVLSDEDWRGLKRRESEGLTQRTDLDEDQRKFRELLRLLEIRSEWACSVGVVNRNLLVAIVFFVVMTHANQVVEWMIKFLP
jgi:lysozyme family protein